MKKWSAAPGSSKGVFRNRFAIGDVHGCPKTLLTLIEEQIQPIESDHFYLLGDYIGCSWLPRNGVTLSSVSMIKWSSTPLLPGPRQHLRVEPDYVLCHAGLNFRTADPINDTSNSDLLWLRDSPVQAEKLGGRTLLCGHTVTPLFAIEKSLESAVINLDNGCFDKGHGSYGSLVALNLETRELLVQENVE